MRSGPRRQPSQRLRSRRLEMTMASSAAMVTGQLHFTPEKGTEMSFQGVPGIITGQPKTTKKKA